MSNGAYDITHKKILESGKELFLKNGYERTNLRELCKKAGVTTGAFYRHFEDKSSIFRELVDDVATGLLSGFDSIKCQVLMYKKSYIKMHNYSDLVI